MLTETTKGITILATGHPYYGRMAHNLTCTIKAVEPEMPVAVIHKGKALQHLSQDQANVFDYKIEMPDVADSFGAKLHLYELTPFEETLYMDVDMLWLPKKKPSELMAEFEGVDFTGITEGYYNIENDSRDHANPIYYFWGDPAEIKSVYGLTGGRLYQWRSEVMFFRKTELMDSFWRRAQEIHRNAGLKTIAKFGEQVPDELAINISAAIHDIHPHKFQWTPAYWHKLHRDIVPDIGAMSAHWYMMSFGGNFINGTASKAYDQIMKLAMRKLGKQHVFSIASKKSFLTERAKM